MEDASAKTTGRIHDDQLLSSAGELVAQDFGPVSTVPFLSDSCSSPNRYSFIISLASEECPTSSKASVESTPAFSIRISSPPGCYKNEIDHIKFFLKNMNCYLEKP